MKQLVPPLFWPVSDWTTDSVGNNNNGINVGNFMMLTDLRDKLCWFFFKSIEIPWLNRSTTTVVPVCGALLYVIVYNVGSNILICISTKTIRSFLWMNLLQTAINLLIIRICSQLNSQPADWNVIVTDDLLNTNMSVWQLHWQVMGIQMDMRISIWQRNNWRSSSP